MPTSIPRTKLCRRRARSFVTRPLRRSLRSKTIEIPSRSSKMMSKSKTLIKSYLLERAQQQEALSKCRCLLGKLDPLRDHIPGKRE